MAQKARQSAILVQNCALPPFLLVARTFWQPGLEVHDGRDNLGQNALWIGHGWLGDNAWFTRNSRHNQQRFRGASNIQKLAQLCAQNGVTDVFPHLCPTQPNGRIAAYDDAQVERFLNNAPKLRVLPWIGGRLDGDARLDSKIWRANFVASVAKMFHLHPRLAGVHLNLEPWKSGDANALGLLDELRAALPSGKILSVSAYPPTDWFYPFRRGWNETYFRQIAARCEQIALMAYDSSAHDSKLFQWFVARWTQKSLQWTTSNSRKTRVLIGVPTYADAGTTWGAIYHNGNVEDLANSLRGIHRGLGAWKTRPAHFQGVAVYSEWETDVEDWRVFRREWNKDTQ